MTILDNLVHEAGQVAHNFERKVTKWSSGLLDSFAGVAGSERDSQVLANSLELIRTAHQSRPWRLLGGVGRKCVQVSNKAGQVFVMSVWLESQLVFERNSVCCEKIEGGPVHHQNQPHCGENIHENRTRVYSQLG